MKICINALAASLGGGFTYITNILPFLNTGQASKHTYVLLVAGGQLQDEVLPENVKLVEVRIPLGMKILRVMYEQLVMPILLGMWRVDLLFSPQDMTTLLAPCRVVLAMRNPNLYTKLSNDWTLKEKIHFYVLSIFARLSKLKARWIIFVSEDSRQWISKAINIPLSSSVTVHHGIDLSFISRQPTVDVRKEYGLTRPFILSVSTIYPYKNYIRLIQAYHKLLAEDFPYDLVIVGKNMADQYFSDMQDMVQSLQLSQRVHLVGGVKYSHVFSFYRDAEVFVFPSFLETFGHPLLEAMALDVPVIASKMGVFEEIAAAAAVYCDPFDVDDMARQILNVVSDKTMQSNLVAAGKRRRELFSWEKTVKETVAVFEKAHI